MAYLLISIVFFISAIYIQCTDTAEYYVSSPNGTLCPDNTICRNLSFYILQDNLYFTNDTVFYFLEGTHVLEHQQLLLIGLRNVTFLGEGNLGQGFDDTIHQSVVTLTCSEGIGGIVISESDNIKITGVVINNCSSTYIDNSNASLSINNSFNINLENLSIQNGSGNGLFIRNALNTTISNCSFARNTSPRDFANIFVEFHDFPNPINEIDTWNGFLIESSNITSASNNGLYILFYQQQYTVNLQLHSVQIINNHNASILVEAETCLYNLLLTDIVCNGAQIGFEMFQHRCKNASYGKPVITITNSIFSYNRLLAFQFYWYSNDAGKLIIESTRFFENSGSVESAMNIEQLKQLTNPTLEVMFFNVTFTSNKHNETLANMLRLEPGVKYIAVLLHMNNITVKDCVFANNDGTGLLLYDSYVTFTGKNLFINNTGVKGGAILMLNNAFLLIDRGTNMSFIDNHATFSGGAIHISQYAIRANDGTGRNTAVTGLNADCFYQVSEDIYESSPNNTKYFYFRGNTARIAGTAIYGGVYFDCMSWAAIRIVDRDFFFSISNIDLTSGISVISSNARDVCFCNGINPICNETRKNFTASPGSSLTFAVTAVGSANGTTTGTIQVRDQNAIQSVLNMNISAECTNITHLVQVTNSSINTIEIYVTLTEYESNIQANILNVSVDIQPCPVGFDLSDETRVCNCSNNISSVGNVKCDPSTGTIERSGKLWIAYDSNKDCISVNQECPFDFCNRSNTNFTLTKPNDQCSFNRIGRLCGGCEEHFSVVLGSNKCKECSSNVYILLIIPFALAGITLVVFLLILNLTVSVGTINGLIFYANIVKLYEPLFPTEPIPFLRQFISWINLDLGIETCFYKGMNACEKTGLQFIFPFYLWFIIGLIILLSRYFSKISKLVGNNATPVLATLLLLSYTKLLRTAILILSLSHLSCGGNSDTYWYVDANIPYFRSCHLPLFITAIIVLILLVVPYTLFLLLFPLLEFSRAKYRSKLSFLMKFKPFFDAYGGPHIDYFRFWPGVLLLARVILAFSVGLINNSTPPLGVLVLIMVLLITVLSFGKIYTSSIHVIDIWFLLSLIVLAYVVQGSEGEASSEKAEDGLVVIFTLSFIVFCGIILYHVYKYSMIRKYFEQEWLAIKNRRKKNIHVLELEDTYTNTKEPNVSSTYIDLREPLLESAFTE